MTDARSDSGQDAKRFAAMEDHCFVLIPRREIYGKCILPNVEFATIEGKEWSFIFLLLLILELITGYAL